MRSSLCIYLCLVLAIVFGASAEEYREGSLVIQSNLDSRFIKCALANASTYYKDLTKSYFNSSRTEPVLIYYSDTVSDARRLLKSHGHESAAGDGFYVASLPAIYVYHQGGEGDDCGFDPLFAGLAHHLVQRDYNEAPLWFSDGLTNFLSEQVEIVDGKPALNGPNLERMVALRNEIQDGKDLKIKRLLVLKDKGYAMKDWAEPFATILFSWLHETDYLKDFCKAGRTKGFDLTALLDVTGKSVSKVNNELNGFIREQCGAGALLYEALKEPDNKCRRETLLKALQKKPDYHAARLELAKLYYAEKEYETCQQNLTVILNLPDSAGRVEAAILMGDAYRLQKNYNKALGYYEQAWQDSYHARCKYVAAYKIAGCHYYLENEHEALSWYRRFLELNWQKEKTKAATNYAKKYIEVYGGSAVESD